MGGRSSLQLLTERQLADLCLKVHIFFPPETDPDFSRGGFVTPRQSVVHFRGDILGVLEARGTDGCWNVEVCTALDGQLMGDYLRLNGLTHGNLPGRMVCV